jgi:hypothetical protein
VVRTAIVAALMLSACAVATPASADLPNAATLLADLGYTPDQVEKVQAGEFVRGTIQSSGPRELVAAFAFQVPTSPADLVEDLKKGLLDKVDPGNIAFGFVQGAGSPADFAKLIFGADATARAAEYVKAQPGGPLNLSKAEIASFQQLGADASPKEVEQAVISALLARVQAYRAKGLAGIAPYVRDGGERRSPGDELRSASQAMQILQKYAPHAYSMLLEYPNAKPLGTEETFFWTHFIAQDVPTIALTHSCFIPEGAAWIVVQRQFYVSVGYNSEQAVAAFFPTQSGTVVMYANRTSTDQIEGFGGGAKRSIGSRVMASQLQSLFEKVRRAVK